MKIAISAEECSFTSAISNTCSRCSYFVIHDFYSGSTEFLPNPNKDMKENDKKLIVELMKKRNVQKIISRDFGHDVKEIFDSHKIQMIVITKPELHVGEIIHQLGQTFHKINGNQK